MGAVKSALAQLQRSSVSALSGMAVYLVTRSLISTLVEGTSHLRISRRNRRAWIILHYRGLRRLGIFPMCAIWIAFRRPVRSRSAGDAILALLPLVLAVSAIVSVFGRLFRQTDRRLWITSPSGRTTIALPWFIALRIARKQGWHLTEVAPIRKITRGRALRILLRGDSH